jgi:hypothetical protein
MDGALVGATATASVPYLRYISCQRIAALLGASSTTPGVGGSHVRSHAPAHLAFPERVSLWRCEEQLLPEIHEVLPEICIDTASSRAMIQKVGVGKPQSAQR